MALLVVDLGTSDFLVFPSSETGAMGFHIWCGGVAGGVRPAVLPRSWLRVFSTALVSTCSKLEFPTAAALPQTSGTRVSSLAGKKMEDCE